MWLSHGMTAYTSKTASCWIWIDDSIADGMVVLLLKKSLVESVRHHRSQLQNMPIFQNKENIAHRRRHSRHRLFGGLLSSQGRPWDAHACDPSHALKSGPHALQRTTGGSQLLMGFGPTVSPNETSTYATAPTAARSGRLMVAAMNDLLERLSRCNSTQCEANARHVC